MNLLNLFKKSKQEPLHENKFVAEVGKRYLYVTHDKNVIDFVVRDISANKEWVKINIHADWKRWQHLNVIDVADEEKKEESVISSFRVPFPGGLANIAHPLRGKIND